MKFFYLYFNFSVLNKNYFKKPLNLQKLRGFDQYYKLFFSGISSVKVDDIEVLVHIKSVRAALSAGLFIVELVTAVVHCESNRVPRAVRLYT